MKRCFFLLAATATAGLLCAQTNNAIFTGGYSDGWTASSYQQAGNNVFLGGTGDGWSGAAFVQAGNGIFSGGTGDGWSYLAYAQAGNGIFAGGQGDGWASVYRNPGPLPVNLLWFAAQKNGAVVDLTWQTAQEKGAAYFAVERSADAVSFDSIGRVKAVGNSAGPQRYGFPDSKPFAGFGYYRLKQVDANGSFVHSPVRSVVFDGPAVPLKGYPVPVRSELTVALPSTLAGQDATLNVVNAAGAVVLQIQVSKNRLAERKTLDLGFLPAGTYAVQLFSKTTTASLVFVKP